MQKCLICGEKFETKPDLFSHYEEEHSSAFPKMTGAQIHFFKNHGRITGKCMMCGKTTEWNYATNRPLAFCSDPKCPKDFRKQFVSRMNNKWGKDHLLNEPEMQKKMLANRSISGKYKWSDGTEKQYVGSYELDFLRFLDLFYKFPSNDVMTPAPQVIYYMYDGKKHFYIPDVYIPSLNLIIEIKDGGSNPNTHPKIMAIDKEKEKLKDEAIKKTKYNYIKLTDKKYGAFVDFLLNCTDKELDKNPKPLKEEYEFKAPETLSEAFLLNLTKKLEYNYLIFTDAPYVPIDSEDNECMHVNNQVNKIAIAFGDRTSVKILSFNENGKPFCDFIDGNMDINVRIYSMKKSGKDIVSCASNPIGFVKTDFFNLLLRYYDDSKIPYLDVYDYVYRSGNFETVFTGSLKDFIKNIENIDNKALNGKQIPISESFLQENHLKINLNTNSKMNSAERSDKNEEEILVEAIINNGEERKQNKKELIKDITRTKENKKYIKLIENAYRNNQIKIIELDIYGNKNIKNNDKVNLIKLAEQRLVEVNAINKDEMDITILPTKIENEISKPILTKLDKESSNVYSNYKNIISEGEFLENGPIAGVNYLRKVNKVAESIQKIEEDNPKINNTLMKIFLGIGDM